MEENINNVTTTSHQFSNVENHLMQGWECPRCGRINAPWKSYCDCKKESNTNWHGLPGDVYYPEGSFELKPEDYPKFINTTQAEVDPCERCSNNPKNGGSGLCNCILGDKNKVTC